MKTLLKLTLVSIVAMMTTTVLAQDWTKEQKEVWQVVESTWMDWKTGNIDALGTAMHEKFQGWSDESPLPENKTDALQWHQSTKDITTNKNYWINPARITVTENAAVIFYYYQYGMTYTMGDQKKQIKEQGKYVEFYVKEKGKWLCLGDFTVADDKDDAED